MSLDVSLYVLRKKEVFEYNITHNPVSYTHLTLPTSDLV